MRMGDVTARLEVDADVWGQGRSVGDMKGCSIHRWDEENLFWPQFLPVLHSACAAGQRAHDVNDAHMPTCNLRMHELLQHGTFHFFLHEISAWNTETFPDHWADAVASCI